MRPIADGAGTGWRTTMIRKPGECADCGSDGLYSKGLCSRCYQQDYYFRRIERDGPRQRWPGYKPQEAKGGKVGRPPRTVKRQSPH